MIDGRICIEVDGPWHFVQALAEGRDAGGDTLVRKRRTKDLFIDHMLRQYGYQVLRIGCRPERMVLDERVVQVRALLDEAAQEEQTPLFARQRRADKGAARSCARRSRRAWALLRRPDGPALVPGDRPGVAHARPTTFRTGHRRLFSACCTLV